MDFKTFAPLVYQSSTSSLQFLTATDTARKNFLIELLNLTRYVEIFEKIKTIHKDVSDKLASEQAKFETISSWLKKHDGMSFEEKPIVEVPEIPSELVVEVSDLEKQIKDVENTNKRIADNNSYISMRDSIPLEDVLSGPQMEIDTKELVSKTAVLKSEVRILGSTINELKSIHGACPTCHQAIDEEVKGQMIDAYQTEQAIKNSALNKLNSQLTEAEESNRQAKKNRTLITNFESYSAKIDESLPKLALDKQELLVKLIELNNILSAKKDEITSLNRRNNEAIRHNASIATISAQIDTYKEQLYESIALLESLEDDFSVLNILKKAFSTNGLIAYKIENSVQDLQELTNEYLAELSDGRFQLSFSINNDKLNVVIVDNGHDIDITALSAGELARVNTSTLLAIRKLMSSLSKTKINVLFLDETIDTLDTFGKEKLIEVLLRETSLNTFLISHGYSHPLLKKIEIVKENNISRVEE